MSASLVVVSVKRTSPRSFNASKIEEVGKRDDDDLILVQQAKTTQHLLIFTNQANVIYRPIHELPDISLEGSRRAFITNYN